MGLPHSEQNSPSRIERTASPQVMQIDPTSCAMINVPYGIKSVGTQEEGRSLARHLFMFVKIVCRYRIVAELNAIHLLEPILNVLLRG